MGVRITDRDDWFDIWFDDRQGMLETMIRNMTADLDNGYDYFGKCIRNQQYEIANYKRLFDKQLDMFKTMDNKKVNRWCFYDMKKRGVIE